MGENNYWGRVPWLVHAHFLTMASCMVCTLIRITYIYTQHVIEGKSDMGAILLYITDARALVRLDQPYTYKSVAEAGIS